MQENLTQHQPAMYWSYSRDWDDWEQWILPNTTEAVSVC